MNTNDELFLSHIPVGKSQPMGEIKIGTAIRRPHVDPCRHCNVKMTSPVASQRISGFSGSLFHVFPRKIRPSRSPFVITRLVS